MNNKGQPKKLNEWGQPQILRHALPNSSLGAGPFCFHAQASAAQLGGAGLTSLRGHGMAKSSLDLCLSSQ